jgi:hypothetical protein
MTQQTFAWNGICFDAPATWQVEQLAPRYLLLESSGHPTMEIRWETVRGKVNPKMYLAKLDSGRNKAPGIRFSTMSLPKGWTDALYGFETEGFRWKGPSLGGKGVILRCPECRNLSLIQFYDGSKPPPAAVCENILHSFRDHRADGTMGWSLFGMKVSSSAGFRLLRHQFEPGYAALFFQSRGERLSLFRWGPATILLKHRPLSHFVETVRPFSRFSWAEQDTGRELEIAGSNCPDRSGLRYYGLVARPGYAFRRFRLWLDEGKNRILGYFLESRKPDIRDSVQKMLDSYETL